MKRKSETCSTGHGTGVTPPVDLGTVLARDRARLALKRGLRRDSIDRGDATYRKIMRFLGVAA